jgi:uncharacterized protein YkwD
MIMWFVTVHSVTPGKTASAVTAPPSPALTATAAATAAAGAAVPQQQQDAAEQDAKRQANAIKLLSASNELKDSQIAALQAEVHNGYSDCRHYICCYTVLQSTRAM